MTNEKIAAIISQVGSQIGETDRLTLRSVLASADDSKYPLIMSVPLKSPTTTLLLSIFLGGLGADRFYIGDSGVGVCKLLFGWLTLGIWPFVDIFVSYKKAKQINMRNITAVAAGIAAVRTSGASDRPRRFFRSVSSQSHGAHRIQCHQRGAEAHCRVRLFQSEPSPCARGVISEFSYARGGIRGWRVWRSAPLFRALYNTTRFVLFRGRRIVYPTEQPPSGKKTAAGLRPNCGQTASFQAFVKAAQRPPAEGHSCGARPASTPVSLSVPKEFCLNAS